MITYKIRLEMAGGREQYTNMEFTTGDVQAYRLEFDFMDNGKAYDCTGHTLTVKAKRSDGSVVVDSGTVEDGKAFYIPANSVFSKPDALELEVALVTADGSYATVKVIHAHVREGFGDGDVTPEDTTPILVNLIAQGEYAKQMGDYAKEQGEWVGEASDAHINDNVRHITAEERAGWNNKVDKAEGKGLSDNNYTDEEKAKLAGVAPEATKTTVQAIDSQVKINTQNASGTIVTANLYNQTGVDSKLAGKVDKVTGKGLSTNDYTTAEKEKLAGIETGAEKNVVTSVAGKTGAVVLDKSDVGLGNLTNYKQAKETDFTAHDGDDVRHITAAERTGWNGKVSQTELSNGLALKADKADFDAHDADEERHITPQERARWDASAIVGDASGEKIVLDDVAPQGAVRELEIYGKSEQDGEPTPEAPVDIVSADNFNSLFLRGKNLLDTTGIDRTYNGITCTRQNDGGVKVAGTSTGFATSTQIDITPRLKKGKTYVKSWTGSAAGLSFVIALKPKDGAVQYPTTFTFDDTVDTVKAYLQIGSAGVTVDTTVYLQVEEGSVATAYEPYGGTVVNIPYELRGVPNTTGGWLARDYIEVKDGAVKLIRSCTEAVFDETSAWGCIGNSVYENDTTNFYCTTADYGEMVIKWGDLPICDRCRSYRYGTVSPDNMFIRVPNGGSGRIQLFVKNSYFGIVSSDTNEQRKTKLLSWLSDNPLNLCYTLATPTIEDITDTETGQALLALTLTAPDAALSNTAESGMAVRYEVDGTIAYKKLASAIVALGGTI